MLVALGAPGAQAATPPPAQDTTGFCANVPEGNAFNDLTGNQANINCLAFTEITTGKTANTYAPGDPVTRGQMATFIARMIDTANELELTDLAELPASGNNAFTDDNGIAPHEANINRLAAAGVVAGVGGGLFAPNQPVSRAQMATFINNAQAFLSGTNTRLTSTDDFFTDDNNQAAHQANINGLAEAGIVQGGPGGISQTLYGPDLPVNRSQMASFIIRYLALAESLDTIEAPGEPATNVSLAVSPLTAETETHDGAVAANTPDDDRTFTATGLTAGTTYRVALMSPADIALDGAIVSFADVDGTADVADASAGSTAVASIVKVNNSDVPAAGAVDATPVSGTITVTIDGAADGHVFPVIWADADNDDLLDLNTDDQPTEAFGLGGDTYYLPAEAPLGNAPFTVSHVTDSRNGFVSGGALFELDSNDKYQYQGTDITAAQFDSMLSVNDQGTVSYNPDSAAQSVFNITTDDVAHATNVIVDVINADSETDANDVRVAYLRPATNSPGVTYSLEQATVLTGADTICGTFDDIIGALFTPVAGATEVAGAQPGAFMFSADDVANGCYAYRVRSTSPVSNNSATTGPSSAVEVPKAPDTTAPQSTSMTVDNNGALSLDSGDEITVVFNEKMAAPAANASMTLTDADGTIVAVTKANATWTLDVAGTTLTVTLTGAPAPGAAGAVPNLQIGAGTANVTDRIGVTDVAGNGWDLAGSADKSI